MKKKYVKKIVKKKKDYYTKKIKIHDRQINHDDL